MDGTFAPGPVRGWWWRSTRTQRLAVAGVGAALGLALLVGAFAWMPTGGPPQAAAPTPVTPLSTIAVTSATTTTVTSTTTVTTTSPVDTTTTTTTPATTTTVTTTPQLPPPITTVEPTTTTDDIQYGVRAGMPCAPEGARGMTLLGVDVVCTAGSKGKLRWRKA
jgi:hypothetical protein